MRWRAPLREAPITHAVALESERLSLARWDPADRFIAATAKLLDATLVIADARLIAARFLKSCPISDRPDARLAHDAVVRSQPAPSGGRSPVLDRKPDDPSPDQLRVRALSAEVGTGSP